MFCGEGGKPFLQEAAVEIRIVGDDEHYPAKQIVDSGIVNAMTGNHLIGDAGNACDLRRDRNVRIFQPLPGAEDFVDLSVLTVILEEADAELLFLMLRPKKNDQSHQVTAAAAGGGTGPVYW